jgi:RNA polymerase sigma-70 factor (ECF subfamily)
MEESLNNWFTREILAHERSLMGFIRHAWRDQSEVEDLCHETYIRVYESAAKARPISPRGYLFATARNLMAERIRRSRIVSIESRGDLEALNILIDKHTPEHQLDLRQDLMRLVRAFEVLSPTSQQVVWMIKVEEFSHKEVAGRLKLTPKAVERRIARALVSLERAYATGDEAPTPAVMQTDRDETDHG